MVKPIRPGPGETRSIENAEKRERAKLEDRTNTQPATKDGMELNIKNLKFPKPAPPPSKDEQQKLVKTDRKTGLEKIEDIKEKFDDSIDYSKEKILNIVGQRLELTREKLSTDSSDPNFRILKIEPKSVAGFFNQMSPANRKILSDSNKAIIGARLKDAIQAGLQESTLSPLLKNVQLGKITENEARDLISKAAETLSEDPAIMEALAEIDVGEKAQGRRGIDPEFRSIEIPKDERREFEPYSAEKYMLERFELLLKAPKRRTGVF